MSTASAIEKKRCPVDSSAQAPCAPYPASRNSEGCAVRPEASYGRRRMAPGGSGSTVARMGMAAAGTVPGDASTSLAELVRGEELAARDLAAGHGDARTIADLLVDQVSTTHGVVGLDTVLDTGLFDPELAVSCGAQRERTDDPMAGCRRTG
jgi:hypothetical protein